MTRETIRRWYGAPIFLLKAAPWICTSALCAKAGDAGRYICTVRKVGYKLADSEEGEEE